jgi:glucose uptake protein
MLLAGERSALGLFLAAGFCRQGRSAWGLIPRRCFCFRRAGFDLILNLFLMNLPVEGEPLEIFEYVRGPWTNHLWGLAGGAIWSTGLICLLAVASLPETTRPGPAIIYGLSQGWVIVAAVWGIVTWKELQGGGVRAKVLEWLNMLLLVGGITLLAVAPLFVKR